MTPRSQVIFRTVRRIVFVCVCGGGDTGDLISNARHCDQMISKVFFSSMINCQSDFCISSLNQFFRASID